MNLKQWLIKMLVILALLIVIALVIILPTIPAHAAELDPSGLQAEDYDKLLNDTDLQGIGAALEIGEKITGINGLFIMSICALESGWGTSNAAKSNNIGGIQYDGKNCTYESRDECIYYMFDFLDRLYIRQGLDTIKEIGPVYCQSPESTWAEDVRSIMRGFINGGKDIG